MAADKSSVRMPGDSPAPPLTEDATTITPAESLPSAAEPAASSVLPPAYDDKTVISKSPPLATDGVPPTRLPQLLGSTLIGKRLEHYELTEFVGGGGMGAVFRATDTRLGRTVAVKVLSRDYTDEETIRRFKNEAQSAARLDHPNIARVYYVGEDHGWNFIVFEFIEGTNLRDDVEQNGPLELEQALHYTLQVAEALNHSSSRDVVHRDIKPSNVLVTAGGGVKLVDMGLARQHQVESSSEDLTASGVMLGTFDYISPEQSRDPRAADVRSDIYSLGCTLYFMLTGQPPFPEGTPVQKLLQHNSDDPPDVRRFRPDLHQKVSSLLSKMLAKRPAQRQQNAAELIADMIELGRQLGLPRIAEYAQLIVVPGSWSTQWREKLWQIAGAVALLALAIVGLELIVSPRQAGGDVSLKLRFKKTAEPSTRASEHTGAADQPPAVVPAATSAIPASESAGTSQTSNASGATALASSTATDSPVPPTAQTTTTEPGLSPTATSRDAVSSSLPSSATPITEAPADQRVRRVVVLADTPAPPEPRVEYAATLAEACIRAAELGINEIELRYSGPRLAQQLEIAQPRLTIRAAAGYRPIMLFRPQVRGPHHMIRLSGGSAGHLVIEGVEMRMELPADPPADGWSLIAMSTGQSLELTDSVLTVKDGDAERLPIPAGRRDGDARHAARDGPASPHHAGTDDRSRRGVACQRYGRNAAHRAMGSGPADYTEAAHRDGRQPYRAAIL
jgi:eukaryotic-like serine/threonine-protein kinase